jgi:hypothetical protein
MQPGNDNEGEPLRLVVGGHPRPRPLADPDDLLVEFVRALARRQARIDAMIEGATNDNRTEH